MDLVDLMESELTEHVEEPTIRFVKKNIPPNIQYIKHTVDNWDTKVVVWSGTGIQYINPSTGKPVIFGHGIKPNTPSRFELDTMRDRLNSHRRWIQLGILIGTIGLGSRIPQFIEWYNEENTTSPPVAQIQNTPATINTTEYLLPKKIPALPQPTYGENPKPTGQESIQPTTNNTVTYKNTLSTHQTPVVKNVCSHVARSVASSTVVQHPQEWTPVFSWGDYRYNPIRAEPKVEATPNVTKKVEKAYRAPRRICVKNSWQQRCYSRRSKSIHERQEYRRLEKKLRNQ